MPRRRRRSTQRRKPRIPASQAGEWWSIRRILDERTVSRKLQYLVDWEDNAATGETFSPTWVPASDVLEDAIDEWEQEKESQRHNNPPGAWPVEGSQNPEDSQPPRPANYRRTLGGSDNPSPRKSRKFGDLEDYSRDEAVSSKRRRFSSPSPSVEPVPSITSSSSFETTDEEPIRQNPPQEILVEIKNGPRFDPSEYLSAQGSQTTIHGSQSLSDLESQDQTVAIASQLSQRTIPDSQEPSSLEIPDSYSAENQHSSGQVHLIIPDSQGNLGRPGSLPENTWISPKSATSRHREATGGLGEVILASTSIELEIPSHQVGPHFGDCGGSPNLSAKASTSHKDGSHQSFQNPPHTGGVTDSQPSFFTQPNFAALSQSTPIPSQPQDRKEVSQDSTSFLETPAENQTGTPQHSGSPDLDTSQAAQIVAHTYEPVLEEFVASRAVTTAATSDLAGDSASDPSKSVVMFPSQDNEPGSPGGQPSRIAELRNLWDDPTLDSASQQAGAWPAHSALQSQADDAVEAAPPGPETVNPQSSVGSMRELVHHAYGDTEGVTVEPVMPSSLQNSHQGTVSPADVSKPGEAERALALLPSLPIPPSLPAMAYVSSGNSITMGQGDQINDESPESTSMDEEQPTKDHLATLPLQASIRQLYFDTLLQYRDDITTFGEAFNREDFVAPDESLVKRIDELFGRLQNLCDYPEDILSTPIENMAPKEKVRYSLDANSKFNFLYELLQGISKSTSVLVVVRSTNLLRPLCELVEVLELECICEAIGWVSKDEHKNSAVRVTLALPDTVDLFQFDVVVGFDSAFGRSAMSAELESADPAGDRPLVIRLAASYTIEHIDLEITDAPSPLERKNMVLFGMVKARKLITDPPRSLEPHEAARYFIDYVNGETDSLSMWQPDTLPGDILDVYVASQHVEETAQAAQGDAENDRKRKFDEEDDPESKRMRRLSRVGPSPETQPPLTTEVRKLLEKADFKGASPNEAQIKIPLAVLQTLAAQVAEAERAAEANDLEVEYKASIERLDKQVKEYEASAEQVYDKYRSAIQDRTAFEAQAHKAEVALKAKEEENRKAEEKAAVKIANLEAKIARLTDDATTGSSIGATEKLLQEAQDKVKTLERRLETAHNNEEYARKLYQDASSAATSMRGENDELKEEVEELKKKASDNIRNIHEIQKNNTAREFTRQIAELQTRIEELESELDRVREELRQTKNGRRETRQVSVPHSPRMGVLSPRAPPRSGVPSVSRGASPVMGGFETSAAGPSALGGMPAMQFTSPQGGNGRWGHLR